MIMVPRLPYPFRTTRLDRLPELEETRARQQRPLLKNGSRLHIEALLPGISEQYGHRTSTQVVECEALERLVCGCAILCVRKRLPGRGNCRRHPRSIGNRGAGCGSMSRS